MEDSLFCECLNLIHCLVFFSNHCRQEWVALAEEVVAHEFPAGIYCHPFKSFTYQTLEGKPTRTVKGIWSDLPKPLRFALPR